MGPNGGGKSTLLKIILGLHPLQKGRITIDDMDYKKSHQSIGYVPQYIDYNLDFPITVMEVVLMGINRSKQRLWGYSKADKQRAYELLEQLKITAVADKKIGDLSGGQRQRALIARALFSEPKILFLDEPTSNIDIQGQETIYHILKALNEKITIIVITHDISLVIKYATKVLYLNKKSTYHDLFSLHQFQNNDGHICEIELFEMLQNKL